MEAHCKPCKENMSLIQDEEFGQFFRCSQCGTEVEISFDKNVIRLDRIKREGTI